MRGSLCSSSPTKCAASCFFEIYSALSVTSLALQCNRRLAMRCRALLSVLQMLILLRMCVRSQTPVSSSDVCGPRDWVQHMIPALPCCLLLSVINKQGGNKHPLKPPRCLNR